MLAGNSRHRRAQRLARCAVGLALLALLSSLAQGTTATAQAPLGPLPTVRGPVPDHNPWMGSRGEDLTVGLVTFGPGDEIYNYFGHNAIVVQDEEQQIARLYNYGMFRFGPEMLPSYMKGQLTFWVGQTPVHATFSRYIEANRSVRIQELNLAPEARLKFALALGEAVLPKNRYYLYHHYRNNCSTKLRDLLDQAIGGQFKKALSGPARMTYREHTRRYASANPYVDFLLVFWMNDQMERPLQVWDELFLPEELESQVRRMKYVNAQGALVPLVETSYAVFEADRAPAPAREPTTWPWMLAIGLGLGAMAWLTARWMTRSSNSFPRRLFGAQHAVIGLALGLPGLLGFLMWTLTQHDVTYHNENQWLANPLTFLMLPLGAAIAFGSRGALRAAGRAFYVLACSSLALVVLKVLPNFDQNTLLPMVLIVPLNIGYALAHRVLAKQSPSR